MDTARAPFSLQESSNRRQRNELEGATTGRRDLDSAVDMLLKDTSQPPYLKTIVGTLLECRNEMRDLSKSVANQNTELTKENSALKLEIEQFKNALASSRRTPSDSVPEAPPSSVDTYYERERSRSVVIAGLPESNSNLSSTRLMHDIDTVRLVMDSSTLNVIRLQSSGRVESILIVLDL
ncbi:hypothetical protein ANCCAN_17624 [Ancylostoma caninum]|uniref:Uncharacterized protein n=1 Tax=Ancylostoma caninum TaxID=29170 RepID=A0A368FWB5_ANCCA|nr:hypothetical protein ANCCAN_17624 [Ancylostoma caninum]